MELTLNTNIFKEKLNKDFISNNFGKQYLYNKDFLQNTSSIMSLDILNEVLSMSSNWNNHNFVMMLDKERIKYNEYSSLSLEASGQFMRPDPEKVQNWVSKGASIILNDIDKANSGLINISNQLQDITNGRCQGNLYFSMQSRQAFGPHCDVHDVFAIHFEGEKVWNIYENIENNPINHPLFKYSPEERIKKAGRMIDQITLKPGDLLYLPRGQYHDALASKSGSIHIAFGLTYFKPIDLMGVIWEKLILNDFMRTDFNKNSTKENLKNNLKTLLKELEKIIDNDQTKEVLFDSIQKWPYKIKNYSLNHIVLEGRKYKVSKSIKIEKNGLQTHLTNGKDKVIIPKDYLDLTTYILKQDFITFNSVKSNFKNLPENTLKKAIENLENMKVIY
jgi:ribosomal protein L16 Arg81 hydroxylase